MDVYTDTCVHFTGDVNGDGKSDLIYLNDTQYLIAFGKADNTFELGGEGSTVANFSSYTKMVGDFNGDGKTDIIFVHDAESYVYFSNGDGTFNVVQHSDGVSLVGRSILTGDANGDGKSDLYIWSPTEIGVLLSKGDGSFENTGFHNSTLTGSFRYVTGDFNGDGKTDLVYITSDPVAFYIFFSNGDGTFAPRVGVSTNYPNGSAFSGYLPADVNGDGKDDLLFSSYNHWVFLSNGGSGFNLMASMDNGLGGSTEIEYKPSSAWPRTYLPVGMNVETVSRVTTHDGRGHSSYVDYDYENPLWFDAELPDVNDLAARVTAMNYEIDTVPTVNLTYEYDKLNRLTLVDGTDDDHDQAFQYDFTGNITSNSAYLDPQYTYNATHKHAVASAGGVNYTYDANGNMTAGGDKTFFWDAYNRLESMIVPVGGEDKTVTFLYDANGRRIQRSLLTSSLPNKYFGKMVYTYGAWMHKYIYAGNILVAKSQTRWSGTYIAPTRLWYHADHLGSTRIMTRSTGARTNSYDYEAYGASALLGGSASNDRTFTGHIEDTDLGLVYMVARYYDAYLGRFISPDSLVPDINNPQDFNRYSYGNNNPISNTDPTGHTPRSSWGLWSSISNWVWPSSGYSASHFLDQYPHHTLSSFNPVHYPSLNRFQSSLNILGWTPGIGAPFNALNAMISAGDGRWSDAIANTSLALSPPAWFMAAMTKASKVSRTVHLGYNVEKSVWGLKPLERGGVIERVYGGKNTPGPFPVIDNWNGGIATSTKSMDIHAKTYLNSNRITSVGRSYIRKVSRFRGGAMAGLDIRPHQIQSRALDLFVPYRANQNQMNALEGLIPYGQSVSPSVIVNILPIP